MQKKRKRKKRLEDEIYVHYINIDNHFHLKNGFFLKNPTYLIYSSYSYFSKNFILLAAYTTNLSKSSDFFSLIPLR